ncbi:hypothetical protein VTO42DRAFT_5724 [Malbranchea cinnamomea]
MSSYLESRTSRPRSRQSLAQIPHSGNSAEVDKENLAAEVTRASGRKRELQKNSSRDKKLRSKSLGPGGLDALKDASGNRRKSAVVFPLKSILKPSIPLSPPRRIPSFEESRKKPSAGHSPRKTVPGTANDQTGDLIDFSTPTPAPVVGLSTLENPFDGFDPFSDRWDGVTKSETLEEERAREREELERHEREKQAIIQQREARRKSMANRRVSFAPEATLHTWNVVDLADDYTSSSASTNSSRRESSLATPEHRSRTPEGTTSQIEEQTRRRSIADSIAENEAFSSSPFSGSSVDENDDIAATADSVSANDDTFSGSDDDQNSAMSLDNTTARTISPVNSESSSTDFSARLERSLRQAAEAAGTKGIQDDENGDLTTELTNHEISGAFKPWVRKGPDRLSFGAENLSSRLDQENVNPFANPRAPSPRFRDFDDSSNRVRPLVERQLPLSQNGLGRRDSVGNASTFDDQTMEFTSVIGGIAQDVSPSKDFSDTAGDEELTMEFTSVVGGVLSKNNSHTKDESTSSTQGKVSSAEVLYPDLGANESDGETEMEMTGAVGGILPPIEERTELSDDETVGMDMTNAVGRILTPLRDGSGRTIFEEPEPNESESSPFQEHIIPSPVVHETNRHVVAVASESGSPSLANVNLKPQRSTGPRTSVTPTKPARHQPSQPKTATPPSRTRSPQRLEPRTPETRPSSRRSLSRSASPQKSMRPTSQSKPIPSPGNLFRRDSKTGLSTPSFILKPQRQSPSGLGIDKEGLGSPRLAEMLDKRRSIGDDHNFVLQKQLSRGVRFGDAKHVEDDADCDLETLSPERPGRGDSQPGVEKDPTVSLREMISSLTPKKNRLKGRKSLHVGSAKGLLGKRPPELDEEDDENNTPKRLKGREASPVKNIKLPAPPSKAETIGRTSRLSIRPVSGASPSIQTSTTPKGPYPLKDIPDLAPPKHSSQDDVTTGQETSEEMPGSNHRMPNFKPIQLSEFLRMANIHFMELTTTKRRHTLAPDKDESMPTDKTSSNEVGLEDCVAAGLCTIPMLELYQHSCRELKSYISEGRLIIRDIETETYADNPPLFQEYITAPPDIRLLMDNQFRNVKAHARLQSKAMWYEWRMKLLEGLKQGLDRHVEEMNADNVILSKKEKLLDSVVPALAQRHAQLEHEAQNLQRVVEELESYDQEELCRVRGRLSSIDSEIAVKKKRLEEMQAQLQENTRIVETGTETRVQLAQEIREAEQIIEECRGWSVKEVQSLKASVYSIEKKTGWSVVAVKPNPDSQYGPTMTLRYRGELFVDFQPGAFSLQQSKGGRRSSKSSRDLLLSLRYSPESSSSVKSKHVTSTPEKALMLHAMRSRLTQLIQGSMHPKTFLAGISRTWDTAYALKKEIQMLGFCGVTRCRSVGTNDSEPRLLKVRCILLNPQRRPSVIPGAAQRHEQNLESRIDIDFTVKPRPVGSTDTPTGVDVDIDVDISASKVYGFGSGMDHLSQVPEAKICDFLNKIVQPSEHGRGSRVQFGNGLWRDAVKELERKIFAA